MKTKKKATKTKKLEKPNQAQVRSKPRPPLLT
jgi:hypothetical protein